MSFIELLRRQDVAQMWWWSLVDEAAVLRERGVLLSLAYNWPTNYHFD